MGRNSHVLAALILCAMVEPLPAQTDPSGAVAATMRAAFDAGGSAADSLGEGLGPSTDPPWTPSRPVRSAETWESVLRLPGQVALLPVSLLAATLEGGLRIVEETNVVPRVMYVVSLQDRYGVYLAPASLGDRTGFGAALRLEPPALGGALAVELSGSTAKYNRTHLRVGPKIAHLDYLLDWQPRRQFFGAGARSDHDDESAYASRTETLYLNAGHAWTPSQPRGPRTEVQAWTGVRDLIVHRGRDPELPSFEAVFAGSPYPIASYSAEFKGDLLDRRVAHMVFGARLSHDTRAGSPHWSHGWRAAVQVERFDKPLGDWALRDAHTPAQLFTRLTYEAEAGFSFHRDPRTVRLLVRVLDMRIGERDGIVQLPDLARLGGSDGLAGFEPGRFQDLDSVLGKLGYIFPLSKHLELDVHTEWGGVTHDLAELDRIESSYGVALRPRLETAPLGSIGVDWSREELRIRFSVGGVE